MNDTTTNTTNPVAYQARLVLGRNMDEAEAKAVELVMRVNGRKYITAKEFALFCGWGTSMTARTHVKKLLAAGVLRELRVTSHKIKYYLGTGVAKPAEQFSEQLMRDAEKVETSVDEQFWISKLEVEAKEFAWSSNADSLRDFVTHLKQKFGGKHE